LEGEIKATLNELSKKGQIEQLRGGLGILANAA
jgi:hypothetical protein